MENIDDNDAGMEHTAPVWAVEEIDALNGGVRARIVPLLRICHGLEPGAFVFMGPGDLSAGQRGRSLLHVHPCKDCTSPTSFASTSAGE